MRATKQRNPYDCGLHIVQSLYYEFHKKWINIENIRNRSKITNKGLNIKSLIELGRKYDLMFEAFEASFSDVLNIKNEWMISLVDNNGTDHYIIFQPRKDYVMIIDPEKGKYKLLYKEFEKIYKNIVISVNPKITEKDISTKKNVITYLFKDISLIMWVFSFILLSITFMFVSSIFMKIIFDKVLPGKLTNLLNLMIIAFLTIAFLRTINEFLKRMFVKKIALKIETKLTYDFYMKINKTYLMDIDKMPEADILKRLTLIEGVSSFISTSMFVFFEEILILLVSSALLMWINMKLFTLAFGLGLVASLLSFIFHFFVKSKYDALINTSIGLFAKSNELIRNKHGNKYPLDREISLLSAKNKYKSFKTKEMSIYKIMGTYNILGKILSLAGPIIITYLFVKQIFINNYTAGDLLLFLTVYSFFLGPIESLTGYFLTFNQNLKNYQLVDSILKLKNESINEKGIEVIKIKELEINNLVFGYDKTLLDIKNIKIKSNIKFAGDNGTGKSSLLKILSFRYPLDNQYKINGYGSEYYNLEVLRSKTFYLTSDSFIASRTIYDYLTSFNQQRINILKANIKKYKLDKFLALNSINLKELLIDNGKNVSSGQKQIILLLRLFTKKYDLIILDEALENVSTKNVAFFKKHLRNYQKDAIFVEVSHSKKYIGTGKEVSIEKINKSN